MEDKPESFSSSQWVLDIVKNWRSLPLIVPHPGVFQGGSWNDPYKKGKNNIRSSTATAKAHFKIHCQWHSGPKGWVLVSKETSCERILIKFHLHNLDQASNFKTWPNVASESRPRIIFITSTKDQQQILNKLQLQNLASKSGQNFHFMTKLQLPNLHQTIVNTFLSINISNSNNLNKFWVGIFTRQGHINQVY